MKATRTKTRESVLRMTIYHGHTIVPTPEGFEVYRPDGRQLAFGGITTFSWRAVRALVRLARIIERRR